MFTSSLPYLKCRWEHSQHSLGDKRTCEECKAHEGIVTALEFGYATFLRKLWEVADPLILDWAAYTSPHDWPTAAFKLTFQHAFDMCQGLFLCLFDEVPDDERYDTRSLWIVAPPHRAPTENGCSSPCFAPPIYRCYSG